MCVPRSGLLAAIVMLATVLPVGQCLACSCAPPPQSAEEVMRMIPVLFWGRAVAVQDSGGDRVYAVEVWGGNAVLPGRISVRTARHSAACGIELPLSQVHLIGGAVQGEFVHANLCTQYWVKTHHPAIVERLKACAPFQPCPGP